MATIASCGAEEIDKHIRRSELTRWCTRVPLQQELRKENYS
jgi:hypothetical protein